MESIWMKTTNLPKFESVKSNGKTEVLIVGGGMAGLICGHFFRELGTDYMILEKDRIANGTTGHTTGKITSHHGLIYSKLIKEFGTEVTAAYREINEKAIYQYREMAKTIDFDFEEKDNYVYSLTGKSEILAEIEALDRIGGKSVYAERTELPFDIAAAVKTAGQGQFHPLKFIKAIAEGQKIYEHSFVRDVKREREGFTVYTENDVGKVVEIKAKKVIIATHFPFIDRRGLHFMKMYQSRSFVLALEGERLPTLDGMYIDSKTAKKSNLNLSFRSYDKYLLIGGGGGRTGTGYEGLDSLRRQAKILYPGRKVAAEWSAQDCMTLDHMPYIGSYTQAAEGLYVATGFNKWGMTGAMAAAMILTGKIDEQTANVYRSGRSMLRPQLFINTFETAKNFLRPTAPRCTHLGCALKWNPKEKSWDCSCHGSTFAKDGRVINNPAQKDLKS